MITKEFKQRIINELKQQESVSGLTANRFATKIGISAAQWSRIKKGDIDGVLADAKFISIARANGIEASSVLEWKTAKTPAFEYIYSLLETCQEQAISTVLVDIADLGKTHTAKYYVRNNRNAVYIDCSQVKTKQLFVREIARQFGLNHTGRYADVYADLVYYLNVAGNCLVILDEAGDLRYNAFLELKALWNAAEYNVGWFMMGADGLKDKMSRAINNKKVGYTEIFRRYGSRYRQVTPVGEALEAFKQEQVAMVAKANAPAGTNIQKLTKASRGSLTNVYNLIRVMNKQQA